MHVLKQLKKYRYNRNSQNGEDGVIEEICRRLNIRSGWFVEFGAWDGKHLSNTYHLLTGCGWKGVYIEGDAGRYGRLLETQAAFQGRVHALQAMVGWEGENRLDHLLAGTPTPRNFDLLSIDIDSYDYEVWNGLADYKPKIVVIESSALVPPGVFQRHNPPQAQGASFSSLVDLGRRKGYQLVCHTGNCFFVEDSLVPALQLEPDDLAKPDRLFDRGKHFREKVRVRLAGILPERVMHRLYDFSNWRKRFFRKR